MWILTTRTKVRKKKRSEFNLSLASILLDGRKFENNIGFDYEADPDDNETITITSLWSSRSDLEKFRKSELFQILNGAIKTLCEEEDTNFYEVSK